MRAFRRPVYLLTLCTLPVQARLTFAEDKKDSTEDSIMNAARSSIQGIDRNAFVSFMTTGPMLDASKISHQVFESSIPGKVGFGFAMYSLPRYLDEPNLEQGLLEWILHQEEQ